MRLHTGQGCGRRAYRAWGAAPVARGGDASMQWRRCRDQARLVTLWCCRCLRGMRSLSCSLRSMRHTCGRGQRGTSEAAAVPAAAALVHVPAPRRQHHVPGDCSCSRGVPREARSLCGDLLLVLELFLMPFLPRKSTQGASDAAPAQTGAAASATSSAVARRASRLCGRSSGSGRCRRSASAAAHQQLLMHRLQGVILHVQLLLGQAELPLRGRLHISDKASQIIDLRIPSPDLSTELRILPPHLGNLLPEVSDLHAFRSVAVLAVVSHLLLRLRRLGWV